jgi:tyrosine-protein kinase Etk/Wzc
VSTLQQLFISNMPSKWGQLEFTSSDNAMGTIDGLLKSDAVIGRVIREMNLRRKNGDLFHPEDFINPRKFMLPLQKKGVYIRQITDSEVFEIRGYSDELAEAEKIAENVTRAFLQNFSATYRTQAVEAKKALELRLADVKKRLLTAEQALEKYRTENKVFDASEQTKSLISEIAKLESDKKIDVKTNMARLTVEKTFEHPDVKVTQRQKETIDEQIKERQKKLDEVTQKNRGLEELAREVGSLKTVYNSLASAIETASIAVEMNIANAVVVQPPTVFEPVTYNIGFPPRKKLLYLVVALFLGTFFGLFLVFFLEYLDNSIQGSRDLEGIAKQKISGTVPKDGTGALIHDVQTSPLKESIHNLLANMKLFKGDLGKVVSVVGATTGEGKSIVTVLLSVILAEQGKKTLLIDANLRCPTLHTSFKLSNAMGLGHYLSGDATVQDVICSTPLTNLSVVPAAAPALVYPQELLGSNKFALMLKNLASTYDIILIDTPAYRDGSDALLVSKHAQDVLCVAAQGETNQEDLRLFLEAMQRANIQVTGFILNKYQLDVWEYVTANFNYRGLDRIFKSYVRRKRPPS